MAGLYIIPKIFNVCRIIRLFYFIYRIIMYVKKVKGVESTIIGAGQGTSRQVLISPEEGSNFTMRKFVIEPGGSIPARTSGAEHEQYVLGDTGRVGIGDQVYEVGKGDVAFISAGELHWYEAYGEEPFEILLVLPNRDNEMVFVK